MLPVLSIMRRCRQSCLIRWGDVGGLRGRGGGLFGGRGSLGAEDWRGDAGGECAGFVLLVGVVVVSSGSGIRKGKGIEVEEGRGAYFCRASEFVRRVVDGLLLILRGFHRYQVVGSSGVVNL